MAGKSIVKKKGWLGEMGLNKGGGAINWFPGHMAAATRAIRQRLKLSDLVIEVRDARVSYPTFLFIYLFFISYFLNIINICTDTFVVGK